MSRDLAAKGLDAITKAGNWGHVAAQYLYRDKELIAKLKELVRWARALEAEVKRKMELGE